MRQGPERQCKEYHARALGCKITNDSNLALLSLTRLKRGYLPWFKLNGSTVAGDGHEAAIGCICDRLAALPARRSYCQL